MESSQGRRKARARAKLLEAVSANLLKVLCCVEVLHNMEKSCLAFGEVDTLLLSVTDLKLVTRAAFSSGHIPSASCSKTTQGKVKMFMSRTSSNYFSVLRTFEDLDASFTLLNASTLK